jgi:outer membrane protein assembly factor BamB
MSTSSQCKRWLLLAAVVLAAALLAGCGGGRSSSPSHYTFGGDGYPNIDNFGTRAVEGSPIKSSNVAQLKVVWTKPIEGQGAYGSYASTPIINGGAVYSIDLESNVQALDLESGDVIWTHEYKSPSHGPNGLAVSLGRVYGTTADSAFALDQETGEQLWETPLEGAVDMAPSTIEGKSFVSTVPETPNGTYEPGAVGTLYALNGETGKKEWDFATVPKGLWGDPSVNSGGGLWYPPSFDVENNLYAGIGNPAPLPGTPDKPWGSSRPGDNRYTDSLVKLDPETGKLIWYYQQTPHSIYDWDLQNSPVIAETGSRTLAIGSGKSGYLVAVNAKTGKPVWKTAVGKHNGHDKDPLYAMRGEYKKIKIGEVFPGELGGVIAAPASDGKNVYVPIVNHSMTVKSGSEITEEGGSTGEVVAVNIRTGKIEWKRELESPAYGSLLVVNDLVFATTADGVIHALKKGTGGEIWQEALPAGTNAGVMVSGEYLVAGAGLPAAEGQTPQLVAYKIGG